MRMLLAVIGMFLLSQPVNAGLISVTKTRGEWIAILVQLRDQPQQDALFHEIASALLVPPDFLNREIAAATLALANATPHGPANENWTAAKRYLEMLERQKAIEVAPSDSDLVNVIESE